MGSFDAKKPPSKISCLGTFNNDPWWKDTVGRYRPLKNFESVVYSWGQILNFCNGVSDPLLLGFSDLFPL